MLHSCLYLCFRCYKNCTCKDLSSESTQTDDPIRIPYYFLFYCYQNDVVERHCRRELIKNNKKYVFKRQFILLFTSRIHFNSIRICIYNKIQICCCSLISFHSTAAHTDTQIHSDSSSSKQVGVEYELLCTIICSLLQSCWLLLVMVWYVNERRDCSNLWKMRMNKNKMKERKM